MRSTFRQVLLVPVVMAIGCNMEGSQDATTVPQAVTVRTIVPVINASMQSRLRAIYQAGLTAGNREGVFSKVGDDLTATGAFLVDVGCSDETLGNYSALETSIDFFRSTAFAAGRTSSWCGVANAFSLDSYAASEGWTTADVLATFSQSGCPAPYNTPLLCELHLTHPLAALIMLGTNDLQSINNVTTYQNNLTTIVTQTINAGVIPVLSTIPPRLDSATYGSRVTAYNTAIMAVASAQNVPLWDYWVAMEGRSMVNQGLTSDGFDPNIYNDDGANFTAAALDYGYNQRNLTAIQVLAHLKAIVYDDGPADGSTTDAGTVDAPNLDAGSDSVVDVHDSTVADTGHDAVTDVHDTGVDAGVHDTGVDAGVHDTGVDAGVHDTGVDAGVHDTGVDIGMAIDSGADGGLPGPDDVAYTGTFPTTVGETDTSLTTALEGVAREVDVYVPAVHSANPPLLMCFHGTGGSGPEMFADSEAQAVADAYGVIVVCPSSNWISTGDFDHPTAETYWLTYPQDNPDTNVDVLLVRACIEESIRAYNIDPNRVYLMGHSSGSFFTLMLSQILSDRVAAFASNSGGLVECPTTQSCDFMTSQSTCAGLAGSSGWCSCTGAEKPVTLATTGRHPPGWLGHGTDDPLVSVQYTCTLQAAMQALGMTVETQLRVGDGHDMPDNYASLVWPFLSTYTRM